MPQWWWPVLRHPHRRWWRWLLQSWRKRQASIHVLFSPPLEVLPAPEWKDFSREWKKSFQGRNKLWRRRRRHDNPLGTCVCLLGKRRDGNGDPLIGQVLSRLSSTFSFITLLEGCDGMGIGCDMVEVELEIFWYGITIARHWFWCSWSALLLFSSAWFNLRSNY